MTASRPVAYQPKVLQRCLLPGIINVVIKCFAYPLARFIQLHLTRTIKPLPLNESTRKWMSQTLLPVHKVDRYFAEMISNTWLFISFYVVISFGVLKVESTATIIAPPTQRQSIDCGKILRAPIYSIDSINFSFNLILVCPNASLCWAPTNTCACVYFEAMNRTLW